MRRGELHDVSRFIVGQGRTYITAADNDPAHIDVKEVCRNLRAGHALVSMPMREGSMRFRKTIRLSISPARVAKSGLTDSGIRGG